MFNLIGSALGSVGNFFGMTGANSRNRDINNANNNFSASQFANRYQTTVKDMQAAGLNPMLAYGQGGGSPPQAQVPAPQQSPVSGATSFALESRMNAADLLLRREQASATSAQADASRTQALANIAEEARKRQDTKTSASVEVVNKHQLGAIAADIDLKRASTVAATAQAARTRVEAMRSHVATQRDKQEIQIRKPEVGKSKTWWGKNVSPYISDFSQGLSSATSAVKSIFNRR